MGLKNFEEKNQVIHERFTALKRERPRRLEARFNLRKSRCSLTMVNVPTCRAKRVFTALIDKAIMAL